MFRRMIFNLFSLNQDDHSKNWAFMQSDQGKWQLAPFYDITFSPSSYNEHATAFAGFGKAPGLKVMQKLATHANFANWKQAQVVVQEVVEGISHFSKIAKELNIKPDTTRLICKQLENVYKGNKALYQSI